MLTIKKLYANKNIFMVFWLGFMSGLPLLLTSSTLSIWLAENGITKAAIGAFALVGIPYNLKFLWAPLFDYIPIPLLTSWLGRRRSYLVVTQTGLFLALLALALTNAQDNILLVAILAVCVSFFSASQDIVIDAYRVEILEKEYHGAGAATIVFGYRLGMLVAGAGALYLASDVSWTSVYFIMASIVFIGIIFSLFVCEPSRSNGVTSSQKNHILKPFYNFIARKNWLIIFLLIILYKLGDAFLTTMSNIFFLELGYSKAEIASITKVFGLIATLSGGFVAGLMTSRFGLLRTMLAAGIIHSVANLIFIAQSYIGYNPDFLMFTIAAENITAGMTAVALVAYISSLCTSTHTAADYAFLSSIAVLGRTILTSVSGALASTAGWPLYFLLTTLMMLPALLIIWWLDAKFYQENLIQE
jgi:PAT family beta-lactamase induction signal transducer AmpG